jgi:3'(2'), 5'-bisphosphate nucleotidase
MSLTKEAALEDQWDVIRFLRDCLIPLGFWTLDPIDGTSGFLRGGQYAVCLALIVDGAVKVGVLGCPNLQTTFNDSTSERGVLVFGMSGDKAYESSLDNTFKDKLRVCQMKKVEDLSQATFCESVDSSHSSHEEQSQIAKLLGIKTSSLRMDSQAKYAELTRGDAEIYLRLPVSMKYEEKIWVNSQSCQTETRIMQLVNCW